MVRVFLELCRLGWRYPLVEASVTESSWVKRLPPADQRLHPPIRRVPETNQNIGYLQSIEIKHWAYQLFSIHNPSIPILRKPNQKKDWYISQCISVLTLDFTIIFTSCASALFIIVLGIYCSQIRTNKARTSIIHLSVLNQRLSRITVMKESMV